MDNTNKTFNLATGQRPEETGSGPKFHPVLGFSQIQGATQNSDQSSRG